MDNRRSNVEMLCEGLDKLDEISYLFRTLEFSLARTIRNSLSPVDITVDDERTVKESVEIINEYLSLLDEFYNTMELMTEVLPDVVLESTEIYTDKRSH